MRDASANVSKRQVIGSRGWPTQPLPLPKERHAPDDEHRGNTSSLFEPHQIYASFCACFIVRTTATARRSPSAVYPCDRNASTLEQATVTRSATKGVSLRSVAQKSLKRNRDRIGRLYMRDFLRVREGRCLLFFTSKRRDELTLWQKGDKLELIKFSAKHTPIIRHNMRY